MRVFLDTGPIIALHDPRDQHHAGALKTFAELGRSQLITSLPVLTEAATRGASLVGPRRSAFTIRQYLAHPHVVVLEAGRRVFAEALELMVKYADQGVSHTDSTSILFMRSLRLQRIFTFDQAFRWLGFQVIP